MNSLEGLNLDEVTERALAVMKETGIPVVMPDGSAGALLYPLWHCNKCGRDFAEREAESVEVGPDCGECVIACPSCWANVIDEEGSLTPPNGQSTGAE